MVIKYRVHEVAKDFDRDTKDIVALLGNYYEEPKKSMTALEEDELNTIFEVITQGNQVENFDAYFAMQNEKPAPKKEAPKKEAPKAEEKKPEPKKAAEKSAEKPAEKPAKKAEKPAQKKAEQPAKPKVDADPHPFQKREKKNKDGQQQSRTRGERRTVDTRTQNVDLEKYNDKYEQIAPQQRQNDRVNNNRQKLNQKSKQYRKQRGVRSRKRETEQERLKRIAAERAKKQITIQVGDEITVGDLASELRMTAAEVIKKLLALGQMAGINDVIDFDTASIVAEELGAHVEKRVVVTIEDRIIDDTEDEETDLLPRDPVVCVMGHVDHGKTSILDAIRNSNVTAGEAGGITQAIGAYRVNIDGKRITFLDTPGHAAFTEMRARGAMATDIAILVVAADDGIMPQTIEAINHAKAANIPMVVAINKMDKPDASPDRILQQLTEHEIVPEDWGGDTICVPVSAKTGMNLDQLLESVLLVAEMLELKANPNRAAKGVVIEAKLDKGRGPVATLLVQNGTLNTGDIVVAGTAVGRVRVMTNERGKQLKKAGPAVPVEVTGLAEVPQAGDAFDAVSDEKLARELVEQRKQAIKEEQFNAQQKVTLDNLFASLKEGELKDLNVIVKADVQGSVEAVKQSLEKLSNDEVRVRVIHGAAGGITDSDVMLANASNAIIIGFNVRPEAEAVTNAERDGVEIRTYRVIYDCINDVQDAIKGMLAPKFRDVDIGRAEVRNVFKISSAGTIAGSYVLNGKITRDAKLRVVRDGIIVAEDAIQSLRRFKDDVKEVATGYECGIGLEKFNDLKEGDIFEAYITEEYRD
ncbi:MAG: translation initiation factor IF-2 [Clostridiales bacterium]|nr:translation initiation factor IF-2 [Clostridia bacterium]MBQ1313403.1 translation initiation factor IF-2 [Clostridia bacterium]MBR1827382.1 translation initiation factor IF-2 [Clostridia bacterium]MEE1291903.1 translation initiation factor IF-2 [Acutalibacteraceae bacterium]NLD30238.1 translation initiation factor IF-2 [Clostridiales bacterium]